MDTEINQQLIGLGIALGVGLLVGMEREWAEEKPVGLRSFALIGLMGGLLALLAEPLGHLPLLGGLIALGAILALRMRENRGITTHIAALVVFVVGAVAVAGFWAHAIVTGGVVTLLLHWKRPLHGWIERLGQEDFDIVARFVLLAAVVLPILPDRTFGPYAVFNPFETWLLVVLIVAINLAGYIALRLFGTGGGLWMAGIFGGLVSSTATAVGYAGLTRESRQFGLPATLIIVLASTVVYARIGVELAVVAPGLLPAILPPMAVYSVFLLALCTVLFMRIRRADAQPELPASRNPARIPAALAFGAAYAVILFAIAAARDRLGDEAIYAVALISGLTDVDALTLSVGQLFAKANLDGAHAWRAIFVGTLSNLAFKVAAASVLGSAELRRYILLAALPALLGGILLLWLWPD